MKILYWTIKTISVLLLAIPLLLCVPGLLLHVISEELEEKYEQRKTRRDN